MLLNLKLYSFDLTPLGNVRYRFEFWDGMNQKNFGYSGENAIGKLNDKIIFQRIIAGFRFASSTNFVFVVSLQDSRAFGSSLTSNDFKIGTKDNYYIMNPNEEFFDFNNLYVEVDSIFGYTNLTLGRQKIAYGDFRAFGPGEWGNTGRWTWDAFKIAYRQKKNFIDLFVGGTKTHNPNKLSI
ncbi:MAG: alginate export family protein, partial [Candidatus Kapaibacteriota bacterium]